MCVISETWGTAKSTLVIKEIYRESPTTWPKILTTHKNGTALRRSCEIFDSSASLLTVARQSFFDKNIFGVE